MKTEFTEYLDSMKMTRVARGRINTIHQFYEDVCPEAITDIFVTDYVKDDGTTERQNLWFFSENYCMEAHDFMSKDDFDIALLRNRVARCQIKKENYDFKNATEKSKLHLEIIIDFPIICKMKAARENCDHLRDIMLKHFVSNLKR